MEMQHFEPEKPLIPAEDAGPMTFEFKHDGKRILATVPKESIWLYEILRKQESHLSSIKTAAWIMAIILLLVAILSACSGLVR